MSEEMKDDFMEEDDDIITLMNDQDEEIDFYHIATLDHADEWYILLQPVELLEEMEEDEILIFKLGTDDEGNDTFIPVEDQAILDAVYDEYVKEAEAAGICCEDDDCDCHEHGCGCGCDHGDASEDELGENS